MVLGAHGLLAENWDYYLIVQGTGGTTNVIKAPNTTVDPHTLTPDHWLILLYPRGKPRTGDSFSSWGGINRKTYDECMDELKNETEQEMAYERSTGRPQYLTHTNYLGPIAIYREKGYSTKPVSTPQATPAGISNDGQFAASGDSQNLHQEYLYWSASTNGSGTYSWRKSDTPTDPGAQGHVVWTIFIYADNQQTGGNDFVAKVSARTVDEALAQLRLFQKRAAEGEKTKTTDGELIPLSYLNWFGPIPVRFYLKTKSAVIGDRG